MKILLDKIMLKISIHTPAKGVTDDCAGSSKTRMISIHTPAKGVTEVKCLLLQNWNNFNPHSREGSDMFRRLRRLLDRISIHTPAKGVTWWSCNTFGTSGHFNPHSREGSDEIVRVYKIKRMDFNPHSREGSDQRAGSWLQAEIYFNPHSREGSDLNYHPVFQIRLCISIHTPAKGVTFDSGIISLSFRFQSTLPRREWLSCWMMQHRQWIFQSTLPRREWLYLDEKRHESISFQSTLPRREWREQALFYYARRWISIHTPAKGVTSSSGSTTVIFFISIHTPAKGVTNTGGISMIENVNFNPHSREGSDSNFT